MPPSQDILLSTKKQHLIIFSRYPESGKTKTRMIPALGADDAANLQRQMTEHTLTNVRKLQQNQDISIEVRFTGGNFQMMADWLGHDLIYQHQGEGDLGEKMARSLIAHTTALSLPNSSQVSPRKSIIIGTDCPGINAQILTTAFDFLDNHNCVIGPAVDGGYYLIGMCELIPELFMGINWGTSQVRQQTLDIAQKLNLSVASLPLLNDVDRPEDLSIWEKYRHFPEMSNG
ncbi:MAG: TIGR04282 family arsenosugar biosynthesis glycosyltransferase [Cyanobacteria bacterium P01_A01_bin.84]